MNNQNSIERNMPIKCATIFQNRIWISNFLFNAFFCYDCLNKELKYIGEFEDQHFREDLHRSILEFNGLLFFIPSKGSGIDVYNTQHKEFEKKILGDNGEIITNRIAVQINHETAWLVPQNINDSLFVLNMKEKRCICIKKWKEEMSKLFFDDKVHLVSAKGVCCTNEKVYLALYDEGTLLEIDIEEVRIKKVFESKNHHFLSINYFEESFYLTQVGTSNIVHIKDTVVVDMILGKNTEVNLPYVGMAKVDNGFILVPNQLEEFYFFDNKRNEIRKLDVKFEKEDNKDPLFLGWNLYEKSLFVYPGKAKGMIVLNDGEYTATTIRLNIPSMFSDEWILKNKFEACCNLENGIIDESQISLSEFIYVIQQGKSACSTNTMDIGNSIYADM